MEEARSVREGVLVIPGLVSSGADDDDVVAVVVLGTC